MKKGKNKKISSNFAPQNIKGDFVLMNYILIVKY